MLDNNGLGHRAFGIASGIGLIGAGFLAASKIGHIFGLLAGLCLFVVGAVVLALPVAELTVDVLSRFFSELFFSDNRRRGPQPIYSIPEARRQKGEIQSAWDALEKITEDHPGELKAYTEMIDIAVIDLSDLDLAEKVLEEGLHALKKKSDREALQLSYSLIVSRLHSREEKSARLQSLDGSDSNSEP